MATNSSIAVRTAGFQALPFAISVQREMLPEIEYKHDENGTME
jgi:hypothetical protein